MVQEATEVGTTHQGTPGGPDAPWWVVLPSEHPQVLFWPNKTQISEKKYEAISNHAYKRSKKTQITFVIKT